MQSLSASTFSYLTLIAIGVGCSSAPADPGSFGPLPGAGGNNSVGSGSTSNPGSGSVTGSSSGGTTQIMVPSQPVGGGAPMIDSCADTASTAEPLPPLLEFLIDTSGSMAERPMMATTNETKWQSTRTALTEAFTDMADGTGTGLIFYPNIAVGPTFPTRPGTGSSRGGAGGTSGAGTAGAGGATNTASMACFDHQIAVPLAPMDAAHRMQMLNQLQRKMVTGRTPTHDAYLFAVQTIQASTLPGNKYVVLVTDGAPTYSLNCVGDGVTEVDPTPIVEEAKRAFEQGVKTFVIGSPGSESARTSLSQIATQGGTALPGCSDAGPNYCHFDMTQEPDLAAALNAAFKAITTQVVSCSYTIPQTSGNNVIDPTKVNVTLSSSAGQDTPLLQDNTPNCSDGWQYSADMKKIELCSQTCAQVKADAGAKVNLLFGCTTMTR